MPATSAPNLNHVSLTALRAVEVVARTGTIRAAAIELGVTPGAVSQQVLKAEAQIGRSLFIRTSGGLNLTESSTEVVALLQEGFRSLENAVGLMLPSPDRLTVSVAPVFAARWLVPRLPALEAQSTELRIHVDATAAYVEPGTSGIDACLRVAAPCTVADLAPHLSATFLAEQHVFPVCAPEIAEKLKTQMDLTDVPIITDRNTTLEWSHWLKAVGLTEDQLEFGSSYSDASLCIDAAISGGGVFLAWDMLTVDAIARDDLVRPFQTAVPSGQSYWLLAQKHTPIRKQLRQFEGWLQKEIAGSFMVKTSDNSLSEQTGRN